MFSSENPQYLRQGLSMFGQSTYLCVPMRVLCPKYVYISMMQSRLELACRLSIYEGSF